MTLTALFVGLVFGFVLYHLWVAPYILRQGVRHGMLLAAVELKTWLASVPEGLKDQIELSMAEYNMDKQLRAALRQIGRDKTETMQ